MNNRNGSTTMDSGTDKIGDKLDERIDSIKDSVKNLVEKGEQRAAAIKDRAVEMKDRAVEVKDQAFTRGNAILDQATDFIKANPFKAVGIAFAAGYVGMRLFL
jgi:ElaB/YqjD/DUF883 family membrane-anchored ribosome-binding protein